MICLQVSPCPTWIPEHPDYPSTIPLPIQDGQAEKYFTILTVIQQPLQNQIDVSVQSPVEKNLYQPEESPCCTLAS